MLKRFVVIVTGLTLLGTGGQAENKIQLPLDFQMHGNIDAVYKIQDNYQTPLDSKDSYSGGNETRDGANNRASQNVRARGSLTMVAKTGEKDYNGSKWNSIIGVAQIALNPRDPDYEDDEYSDGKLGDNVTLKNVWIRYAPAAMVGIKIGVQTIAATANSVGIGYIFPGDLDSDFALFSAAALTDAPGISVDLHLSKNMEVGIGMMQGVPDLSSLVFGATSSASRNLMTWFRGDLGIVNLTSAYQMVSSGGTETDAEGITSYKHEFNHSVMNVTAKFDFGKIKPFVATQVAEGDSVSARSWATLDSSYNALSALGAKRLNNRLGTRDISASTNTVGLEVDLGDKGKVVAGYTQVNTGSWGENGTAEAVVEMDSTTQIAWEIPIFNGAKMSVFYHHFGTKKDNALREDIETATSNLSAVASAKAMGAITSDSAASLNEIPIALSAYNASSTSSMGVAFKMNW